MENPEVSGELKHKKGLSPIIISLDSDEENKQ